MVWQPQKFQLILHALTQSIYIKKQMQAQPSKPAFGSNFA